MKIRHLFAVALTTAAVAATQGLGSGRLQSLTPR